RTLFGEMVRYCTPLLGARVTFLSGQNLGKVVLGKLFDVAQLGYFSFAFQTMERFVDVVHTLPSSLLPSLTQLVALEQRERLRYVFDQAFRLIQVTGCALSFGVFVFAREITLLVGSPLFEPAIPMLRIMALVPIARTAQQPLTMLFQALRLPGTVLVLALIKFVTEFGCYFALVPTVGIAGAAWANLAGAAVSYAVAMILLDRRVPEGSRDRHATTAIGFACFAPFLLLGLLIDGHFGRIGSAVARLALVPPTIALILATGLIRHEDFERL